MKIVKNKILSAFAVMLFTCALGYAGTPPPPTPPPPPGLPIDGGVLMLIFVSVGYGIYKLYQFNFNKKTPV